MALIVNDKSEKIVHEAIITEGSNIDEQLKEAFNQNQNEEFDMTTMTENTFNMKDIFEMLKNIKPEQKKTNNVINTVGMRYVGYDEVNGVLLYEDPVKPNNKEKIKEKIKGALYKMVSDIVDSELEIPDDAVELSDKDLEVLGKMVFESIKQQKETA